MSLFSKAIQGICPHILEVSQAPVFTQQTQKYDRFQCTTTLALKSKEQYPSVDLGDAYMEEGGEDKPTPYKILETMIGTLFL